MPLEPSYGDGVEQDLDKIEDDDNRTALWNKIVEALDLICDTPDAPLARRYAINHPDGFIVWRVPVRVAQEDEDWCVLWAPDGDEAVIFYVGPWPPAS